MKERVAVATVQGKAYFLIVNALKEADVAFVSLIPGQPIPPRVIVAITTEEEKKKVDFDKILVFGGENELDSLVIEVKKRLLGKEYCDRVVVGVDPGESIGLAVVADGKVLEENTLRSSRELIKCILKVLKTFDFSFTKITVKVGNGVPVYRDLMEALDEFMPPQVRIEVVGEAGTNKPLKVHSRKIRHISSAIRIAGRTGQIVQRSKTNAANTSS